MGECGTAIKSMDLMFHVKLRKMMDVGGAEEEDLVPSIKVDSSSIAEGTWTCAQDGQGGQVVLCWDNTRSLLRSKVRAVSALGRDGCIDRVHETRMRRDLLQLRPKCANRNARHRRA
jgi:hypothetical protein